VFDCGVFVAGAMEAVTGVRLDLPEYVDKRSALTAIRALTGSTTILSIARHYAAQLGAAERADVLHAQRGCPVLMSRGGLGIVGLSGEVLTPARSGIVSCALDRTAVARFWSI